jgi:phosphopantothenoylcysteine decarboxylase/phosphopantothenate--cysteine ligase
MKKSKENTKKVSGGSALPSRNGIDGPETPVTVLVGVTAGIAAYKSAEMVRSLVKEGLDVHVVMTRNALEFITPLTFQVLSGNPVWTETFHLTQEQEIGHISLVDRASLFLVAPATANVLGKVAAGIADDLLTTMVCAATRIPVVFAPSMNVNMYQNPVTQANIKKLRRLGYAFIEPEEGDLACGYQGVGRLADPESIVEDVMGRLVPKDLKKERILITAGPTEEAIDPVRFLTNPSSGKMGYAIARAAAQRGAKVTLISGPTNCDPLLQGTLVRVRSAEEMRGAVMKSFQECTAVVMAAAVSDFRPLRRSKQKVKKQDASLTLKLEATPDILLELGRKKGRKVLIGFAAETQSLVKNAREKLKKKNLDLIVANDVSRKEIGFQSDSNQVKLIDADGNVSELPLLPKSVLAHRVLDQIRVLRKGPVKSGRRAG